PTRRSTTGLPPRPGTAVLPTCSTATARGPSASRTSAASAAKSSSHAVAAAVLDVATRLGAPRVQPDRPWVDGVDDEMSLAPRVASERGADLILRICLHHVHDSVLVGERPAQNDEAGVDEPVHEGRVRCPVGLLLEGTCRVPLGTGAAEHDVERRH